MTTTSEPKSAPSRPALERIAVAVLVGCVLAPPLFVALRGMGLPTAVIAVLGALSLSLVLPFARLLPDSWDGTLRTKPMVATIFVLFAAVSAFLSARLSSFMLDPERAEQSVFPFDKFYVSHCCLTAYTRAVELARQGVENLYDPKHYEGAIGAFSIDEYLYPPSFLPLPRLALALFPDFLQLRAVWFGLDVVILVAGLAVLAAFIGGAEGRRLALFSPAMFIAIPTMLTLQFGNFQIAALVLSIAAMTLLETRPRPFAMACGGAMLAFAAVSKIFPGVLVLLLIAQRKWKQVAWTLGFAAFFMLLALAMFGSQPFFAFVDQRVPAMMNVKVPDLGVPFIVKLVALNHAIAAVPMKLRALGVPGMSAGLALVFAWLYTLGIVGAAVRAGRSKSMSRIRSAELWLCLLYLTSLRSPFMPDAYAPIAALWLLVVVAAEMPLTALRLAWLVPAWLALCIVAPLGKDAPDPGLTTRLIAGLLSQVLGIGMAAFVVWRNLRASRPARDTDPHESTGWEPALLDRDHPKPT